MQNEPIPFRSESAPNPVTAALPGLESLRLPRRPDGAAVEPRQREAPRGKLLDIEPPAIETPCRDARSEMLSSVTPPSRLERFRAYAKAPFVWAAHVAVNSGNIVRIFDIAKIRPLAGGLIADDHPWATGLAPANGKPIWTSNVLFRTMPDRSYPESDEQMIAKTGRFLARMTAQSAATPRHPQGLPRVDENGTVVRRMPHAVNYIHGSAHYNGGWIVFNNFSEAFHYFNNRAFRKEIRRFAREEKREITILFRDKDYDTREYGELGGFLRTQFPWYSNTNGPKDLVHWGSRAPYPTVNMITGHFMGDVKALARARGESRVVRPPIENEAYFQGAYDQRSRLSARFTEKLFARFIDFRLGLRDKEKGNLFFVDKRELERLHREKRESRTVKDGKGIWWKARSQEIGGARLEVHDLSPHRDGKGLLPVPSSFDPKRDAIIAISPDYHFHTFLVAAGKEYHGTFLYRNPAVIKPPKDESKVRARMFVVIKDLQESTIESLGSHIESLQGSRSATCTLGVMEALRRGADLHFSAPPSSPVSVSGFFERLLSGGLEDGNGRKIVTEIYCGEPGFSLERTRKEMLWKRDVRFAPLYPVLKAYGWFLAKRCGEDTIVRP